MSFWSRSTFLRRKYMMFFGCRLLFWFLDFVVAIDYIGLDVERRQRQDWDDLPCHSGLYSGLFHTNGNFHDLGNSYFRGPSYPFLYPFFAAAGGCKMSAILAVEAFHILLVSFTNSTGTFEYEWSFCLL